MAWYADLAECDYFAFSDHTSLLAVGWLQRGKPYTAGDVERHVFEKLCELTQDPWSPVTFPGIHLCDLCRFSGDSEATYRKSDGRGTCRVGASAGAMSLFVPGEGVIYVCPTNITHYIDAHGYAPPAVFCDAVLNCPPMRSMQYLKAILDNGGRRWGVQFTRC